MDTIAKVAGTIVAALIVVPAYRYITDGARDYRARRRIEHQMAVERAEQVRAATQNKTGN